MSGAELLALRSVLADRRRALLDRLAVEAAGVRQPAGRHPDGDRRRRCRTR